MNASIFHCNAMAVNAIQNGDYTKSSELLKNALRELRCIQQSQEEEEDRWDALSFDSFCIDSVAVTGITSTINTDIFSLFNRALIFGPSSRSCSPMDEDDDDEEDDPCAKVALVILYNLGLTFQLSHETKTCSSAQLDTALNFYQNAMAMAQLASLKNKDVLIVLAVVNNLGCIFAKRVDYEGASTCLTMSADFYRAADAGAVLSEDDASFFYFTSFLFPKWQLLAAPMA